MPESAFETWLARLLDRLLPADYAQWATDDRRRARVLVGFVVWCTATCIIVASTALALGLPLHALTTATVVVLAGTCIGALHRGLPLQAATVLIASLVLVVVMQGAYFLGGWGSLPLNWLIVLPLLGLAVSGLKAGLAATVAAAMGHLTFYTLHQWGIERPRIDSPGLRLADALTLLLVVTALAVASETFRKRAAHELQEANAKLQREVRRHRKTQTSLETTQQYLVSTARQAGMAEVATGVLHNVGNALTHVATSASLLTDLVNTLHIDGVERASKKLAHLEPHDTNTQRMLATYLDKLTQALGKHKAAMQAEMLRLRDAVTTLAAVVEMQQRYAVGDDRTEPVDLVKAIEHLLTLEQDSFKRRAIALTTQLEPIPVTVTNRHKVLMILVNLLHNALDAVQSRPALERAAHVHLRFNNDGRITLTVSDNGAGIAPEHQPHIFEQGFTTKRHGHGFGLHTAALAARELGGTLHFESPGPGQGAVFTLQLPYTPPAPISPLPEEHST